MNVDSKPKPPSKPAGQFRISTILTWTLVIAVLIPTLGVEQVFDSEYFSLNEFIWTAFFDLIFLCPACTCIPFLVDRLIDNSDRLAFGKFWCVWLYLFVAVYSMLMLCLASIGFGPEWKGSKGFHWLYYTLDGFAALTLFPIYLSGVCFFIAGLSRPDKPKRLPIFFVSALIMAAISFWYSFAVLALNFTITNKMFWIVPGSCGTCYLLYAGIVWRNREWTWTDVANSPKEILGTMTFFVISILVKYPLANATYQQLSDTKPEGCFIVTAATRGHESIVGTWYDESERRYLNQQLLNFWSFERQLKSKAPLFHRWIRRIYNRLGPFVARQIVFKWQADLVYWLLKPLEWLTSFCRIDDA